MRTEKDQNEAARFWKVGQLYRSKNFQNKYIRVIAIGEVMVFVCSFCVKRHDTSFMTQVMNFLGKSNRPKITIEVAERVKNKFFFGWDPVESIDEIQMGDPLVQYEFLNRTDIIESYDIPVGHYTPGKLLCGGLCDGSTYEVILEGRDTLFVRSYHDGEVYEHVRTKNMSYWR